MKISDHEWIYKAEEFKLHYFQPYEKDTCPLYKVYLTCGKAIYGSFVSKSNVDSKTLETANKSENAQRELQIKWKNMGVTNCEASMQGESTKR